MSDAAVAAVLQPWSCVDRAGVERAVRDLLVAVGEHPEREGLRDTPMRVAKALTERLAGYWQDPAEILARDFDGDGYDQMIALLNVPFYSQCEHHLAEIRGTATVVYIPDGKIVGLSKLARLVLCFAHRLQVQERMTKQIADALAEHIKPRGYGVLVRADHSCMRARGVRVESGPMVTSAVGGIIKDDMKARDEFLRLAGV